MRVLLVRHGQTDYNAERRVQGKIDIPLNDIGRWQAERIGARLASYGPTMIFSSDLSRAADTAQAIAAHHPETPFLKTETLREVGYGIFEGMDADEIVQAYPREFELWQGDRFGYMPPEAETIAEQRARAEGVAAMVLDHGRAGDTIIVVSHGAIMRSLVASFLRLDVSNQSLLYFDNTSLTAFEQTNRGMQMRLSNCTAHLGDQAIFP